MSKGARVIMRRLTGVEVDADCDDAELTVKRFPGGDVELRLELVNGRKAKIILDRPGAESLGGFLLNTTDEKELNDDRGIERGMAE